MSGTNFQELYNKSHVVYWAPWAGTLWLAKTVGAYNRDVCIERGFHKFKDVSNAVGHCTSMEPDILFCEGCNSFYFEPFKVVSGHPKDPLLGKCLDGLNWR